ncbi:MAG: hypothetical protein ACYC6T_04950 [Thermoleophilia bacterium]
MNDTPIDVDGRLMAVVLAWILRVGVGAAGALLLGGLVSGVGWATDAGILVLLATPVLVLSAALAFYARGQDRWAAATCLAVAVVLGVTVLLGL